MTNVKIMFAEVVLLTCFFLMNDCLITIIVIRIFPIYLKIQPLSYDKYNLNVYFFYSIDPCLIYRGVAKSRTQLGD